MRILALDPSSEVVGYCLAHNGVPVDAGVLTPVKVSAKAIERMRSLAKQVEELITAALKDGGELFAVVETPSNHIHGSKKKFGGAGAAIYGMAVGVVYGVCVRLLGEKRVADVNANTWTRGTSKGRRARVIAATVRGYDASKDKGLDCADAIGLMKWWWVEHGQRGVA